jgi:hypothetical protein
MVKSSRVSGTNGVQKILRLSVLFSLLFSLNINYMSAQDGGPSLENLSKNAKAIDAETERLKEEARRNEILSYVWMSVGFAVVIGIAWFTTVLARKRSKKELEEKQKFILRQQELKKHGHHHGHGHHAHGHAHGHVQRVKR